MTDLFNITGQFLHADPEPLPLVVDLLGRRPLLYQRVQKVALAAPEGKTSGVKKQLFLLFFY